MGFEFWLPLKSKRRYQIEVGQFHNRTSKQRTGAVGLVGRPAPGSCGSGGCCLVAGRRAESALRGISPSGRWLNARAVGARRAARRCREQPRGWRRGWAAWWLAAAWRDSASVEAALLLVAALRRARWVGEWEWGIGDWEGQVGRPAGCDLCGLLCVWRELEPENNKE
jgi:hypothetical protein